MKKICKHCGKIIAHNSKCSCNNSKPSDYHTKEHKKFYSSNAWRKLRNSKVREVPYCQRCWSKSKIITIDNLQGHHILSFKDYPDCRLDDLNIAVLCRSCNLQLGDTSEVDWEVSEEVRAYIEEKK